MTANSAREAPPQVDFHVGDALAFERSYTEFRDRVFWHALRHTGAVQDAEDITALVFLEAWRKRDVVRIVNGSPLAWLLTTTNYTAQNLARARRRHREAMSRLTESDASADFAGVADDRMDFERRRVQIRAAFGALPVRDQDVLSLCIVAEMSDTDAAIALGVPVGTVKSRLSRAKKKLASLITDLATDAAADAITKGYSR